MKAAITIFLEDLKNSFRTRKIIFIVAIISFIMITIYASGFLQIAYLLFFKPQNIIAFPISITYYLLFLTIPIFTMLLGHDSISSEIENYNIRGIISKIKRSSFIIGKFLSVFTIIASLSFLLLFSSTIYTYVKVKQLDLIHPLMFFLYLLLYIAALTAVSIFFSSISPKNSTSLLAIILFYLIVQYLNFGSTAHISIFHYINSIISLEKILASIITFLSYFAIFISASLFVFGVRDL